MITVEVWQHKLQLETDSRLFSPRQADAGTLAMLSQVQVKPADRLLDLGCGYGLVGLAAAKVLGPGQVVMVDIDPLAVDLASGNARLNGCAEVRIVLGDGPQAASPDPFNWILCNPPYHTDFSVARRLIEQSVPLLVEGGQLVLVVKRLPWYQNKMKAVFGGVRVKEIDGYYVLTSEKRLAAPRPSGLKKANGVPRKHLKRLQETAGRKPAGKSRRMGQKNRTANPDSPA